MFTLTKSPTPRKAKPRAVKCDLRCQYARGPECNCACGGAHHGDAYKTDDQHDLFTARDADDRRPVTRTGAARNLTEG